MHEDTPLLQSESRDSAENIPYAQPRRLPFAGLILQSWTLIVSESARVAGLVAVLSLSSLAALVAAGMPSPRPPEARRELLPLLLLLHRPVA